MNLKGKKPPYFKTFLNKNEKLLFWVTYLASSYLQTYMQSYYLDLQSTLILIFFQNLSSSSSSLSCIIHWTSNPMWHWGFHILCCMCVRGISAIQTHRVDAFLSTPVTVAQLTQKRSAVLISQIQSTIWEQ